MVAGTQRSMRQVTFRRKKTVLQKQTAVTAYFSSKQLQLFVIAL